MNQKVQKENSNEGVFLMQKTHKETFNSFYFKKSSNIEAFSLCTSCGEACDCNCPCDCTSYADICDCVCDCDCSCPSCSW